MRRRSTFINPITLTARISNTALSTTTTTSVTGKNIEVPLQSNNNNKRLSAASYRESVC